MVPILPIIDLLILLGSGSLLVGFVLKAVSILTRHSPAILGLSSTDFLMITGTLFGFALVLAARSWVKVNEHKVLASQMWPRALPDLEEEAPPLVGKGEPQDDEAPLAEVAGAERR